MELAIKVQDNYWAPDRPWKKKLGAIVDIKEDGAYWGTKMLPAVTHAGERKFYLIKIPGYTVAQLNALLQAKWGINWDDVPLDANGDPTHWRTLTFDISRLNNPDRNALQRDYEVVIDLQSARRCTKHNVTGQYESVI